MADNAPVLAPGFDAQSLEVKRRRAMAKLLQESQMPQGQMVSGHYVAPPLLGSINAVARQLMGAYGERKADEQEASIRTTQQQALAELLRGDSGKTPEQVYDMGASDPRLGSELSGQFLTQGFASRISKQKAEAEAAQDAAKAAYQEKRDELRAVQQQARDDARYEQMSQRDQARFDQQQKMQMASFENQNAMLDRRLAASEANGEGGGGQYQTLTPEEIKAAGLPEGTVAQRNSKGKIDVINKVTETKQARKEGGENLDTMVSTLNDYYDQLEAGGGIVSTETGGLDNAGAYISSSGIGQAAGKLVGTKNQSLRNQIVQQRPLLLQAIKNATGMSAKQMDSNVELKLYLSAATDPTLDVQANRSALKNILKLYGSGESAPAATATATPAPAASGGVVRWGKGPDGKPVRLP